MCNCLRVICQVIKNEGGFWDTHNSIYQKQFKGTATVLLKSELYEPAIKEHPELKAVEIALLKTVCYYCANFH